MNEYPIAQTLEVITPSYAPDYELCVQLNSSVLRWTPKSVQHTIIVPHKDLALFSSLAGERTIISDAAKILPRQMVNIPTSNIWINIQKPWPPVRGWISQQIIKLKAASQSEANVVLLVDSDILLLREVSGDDFVYENEVSFFRRPEGIDESLPRHRQWILAAQRLLGLPERAEFPLPDYICCPCSWSPKVVNQILERIEKIHSCRWESAVGRELHFSEMILYGVYVEEVLGLNKVSVTQKMNCINYFDESPLLGERAKEFVALRSRETIAAMISAKSNTPMAVRRDIAAALELSADQ